MHTNALGSIRPISLTDRLQLKKKWETYMYLTIFFKKVQHLRFLTCVSDSNG